MQCISYRNHSPGFTLRDLLAVTACICVLLAIGVPAINASREANRRNRCMDNVRQLGMGILNYESASGRFPTATDAAGPLNKIAPGTLQGEESSGYSWIVKILSSIEQRDCEIRRVSKKYTVKPFAPSVTSFTGHHFATLDDTMLHCPAYAGGRRAASDIPSEYDKLNLPGGLPVITNYAVFAGTHVNPDGTVEENGVIISRLAAKRIGGSGVRGDVLDRAYTLAICETREPTYSAWFDGQATWVLGISWKDSTRDPFGQFTPVGLNHLINVGPNGSSEDTYSNVGLRGSLGWPGMSPRRFGPSSEHAGAVVHLFLDNHAVLVSPECDPFSYFLMITRDTEHQHSSCTL